MAGAVVQGHEIREANFFASAKPLSAVRDGVKATPFTRYAKLRWFQPDYPERYARTPSGAQR